jgi:hypothetical protein
VKSDSRSPLNVLCRFLVGGLPVVCIWSGPARSSDRILSNSKSWLAMKIAISLFEGLAPPRLHRACRKKSP